MGKSWRNPKGIARLKSYNNIFTESRRSLPYVYSYIKNLVTNHKYKLILFSRSKLIVKVLNNAPPRIA